MKAEFHFSTRRVINHVDLPVFAYISNKSVLGLKQWGNRSYAPREALFQDNKTRVPARIVHRVHGQLAKAGPTDCCNARLSIGRSPVCL